MDTRAAEPTTVGEMLSEEFLKPMGITQEQLGQVMGLSRKVVSQIVNNSRRISVAEAATLAALFETDEDFWINTQAAHDRWESRQILASAIMQPIHERLAVI
ncbi:addiction module antidote protein, HigA family [Erwinia sp. OLTSP20]|uniref:HigA family addiction module antitoxin n=1 Tax=Enterobacterales TaxID=91347 RepID=UPI000C18BE6B|nr:MULTISPECIES: HigA family addiction module antitoxin [Enterobacterales]PII85135.1 addiction module antidote protein, HigA family [Serratia sp. OLFL2]PIJ49361.1 addiction module antidote protein, HigA family [Erwinia sp. OAMSP11]PIJ69756.1 addiction module antidote protein, HigA family [Erwinia sp. OLSSP12]PIJ76240.1 addiction module antidote protein, HigA family [Erwinia sp. OLCASP19]PIJ76723.1 addiction module antidote protein, HigA family [Erwinia sp. OLMTSP26]